MKSKSPRARASRQPNGRQTVLHAKVSAPQLAYLETVARQLRVDPADLLVALTLRALDMEDDPERVGAWLQAVRDFVDERKIPETDADVSSWAPLGRPANGRASS